MSRPAAEARATIAELRRGVPAARALAVYDSLPAVRIEEMLGRWSGSEAPTGNPLDGLLAAYGWHGKRFASADDVDPLIFEKRGSRLAVEKRGSRSDVEKRDSRSGVEKRGSLFAVEPAVLPLPVALKAPGLVRHAVTVTLGRLALPLISTRRPKARLRMVEHRGVSTATMIYDALPIHDHFRSIDDATVLGVMDLRGLEDPLFFLLHRESDT